MEKALKRSQVKRANTLIQLYLEKISELRYDSNNSCSSSSEYYTEIDNKINRLYSVIGKIEYIKYHLIDELSEMI